MTKLIGWQKLQLKDKQIIEFHNNLDCFEFIYKRISTYMTFPIFNLGQLLSLQNCGFVIHVEHFVIVLCSCSANLLLVDLY